MKYKDTLSAILNGRSDNLRLESYSHLYETARSVVCDTIGNAADNGSDPVAAVEEMLHISDYYSQRGKLRDCITCIRAIIRDSGIEDEAGFAQICLREILVSLAENTLHTAFDSIEYVVEVILYSAADGIIEYPIDTFRSLETIRSTITGARKRLCSCRNPHVIPSPDGMQDIVTYEGIRITRWLNEFDDGWWDDGIVWEESTLTYQDEQRIEEYMEERDWCIAHGYDSCQGLSLESVA